MPRPNATDLEYGHSHKESLVFHITSLEGVLRMAVRSAELGSSLLGGGHS